MTKGPSAMVLRLCCQFGGYPMPKIQWLKNGAELHQKGRTIVSDTGDMSISQSYSADSGMYQCRAKNLAGVFQSTTYVDIESAGMSFIWSIKLLD